MAQTSIPIGHPMARKVFGAAVFADTLQKPSFRRNLVGDAPKQGDAEKKLKGQTSPDLPIVRVTDLSKGAGDQISVDTFNIVQGKPTMGDRKISGRMMKLTGSSMDVRIDQYRGGVDQGGRMSQQRTLHNLRSIARANLSGWASRLEDQLVLVHLAGARGTDDGADWIVPLDSDPDFADIVVNEVQAPTKGRRFFANDATSAANLDTTDYLKLADIDRIRAILDEMTFPMQPVRLAGDPAADENPLFCLYVTSRQWHYLQTQTGDQSWRTFLSNAHNRGSLFKHPLFLGECGMWNGILIKKMNRVVRFAAGASVKETDANGVVQTVTAAVDTDRALLLGAQALAEVYGKHGQSGYHANWHEETTDHGNTVETSVAFMGGKSKLRFKDADGNLEDHGVMTIDSYAPKP